MIFTDEAALVTLNDIPVGNLALGFGYGHQGMPFLISAEEGAKSLFRLRGEFYTVQDDYRTRLLDLGPPAARFDVESAIAEDKAPDDGTLMFSPDGPGVFENSNHIRPSWGYITLLSGARKQFYRERDTPAFATWEIGYLREQEFVRVATIDAHQNRLSR